MDAAVKDMKSLPIILNQLPVISNILVIDINILVIAVNILAGGLHTLLKTLDSLTERLGSNEHISCLGNLELISMFTEKSTIRVESINSLGELGSAGVGRRGGIVTTVVVVLIITIVVMFIKLVVIMLRDWAIGVDAGASVRVDECLKLIRVHLRRMTSLILKMLDHFWVKLITKVSLLFNLSFSLALR